MHLDSRTVINRREQDAIETELAVVAPSDFMAVDDDDPRRCAAGGVGRFHDIREDYDGVRRCQHCRRSEGALWPD